MGIRDCVDGIGAAEADTANHRIRAHSHDVVIPLQPTGLLRPVLTCPGDHLLDDGTPERSPGNDVTAVMNTGPYA